MKSAASLNLSQSRWLRFLTLSAMYVGQGVPFGFVSITLAAYLSERGLGTDEVGAVLAMSSLPWAFKWVWGPVIDRFGFPAMGWRRPWILFAQLMMALLLGAMIAIPDVTTEIKALTWMIFVLNCFVALQDVSVDALAVDLLEEDERGLANGLMYGSSYFGTWIGGAGIGMLLGRLGLRGGLLVQVGILLCIMLFPLLLRERAGERLLPWSRGAAMASSGKRAVRSTWDLLSSFGRAFSLRSPILAAVIALTSSTGSLVLATAATVYFIQKLGWTQEEFSGIVGGWGTVAGMVGSLFGGFIADRLGARKVIGASSVLLGLAWIGFSFAEPWWQYKRGFLLPFTLVETFLLSTFLVSFYSLAMGVSWPKIAATQFTVYMAFMNVSRYVGARLAPWLDNFMEFGEIYRSMGVFQILVILPLFFIDPHQTRRVLGDEKDGGDEKNLAAAPVPASKAPFE